MNAATNTDYTERTTQAFEHAKNAIAGLEAILILKPESKGPEAYKNARTALVETLLIALDWSISVGTRDEMEALRERLEDLDQRG
tara:strand:- start:116 stop:370 length:255 start_codon:yes stop_codon:yes gene_type:complete